MIIKGRALKYGDDINTDVIIPGRYLEITDSDELSSHCMEDLDSKFFYKYKKGDIIIAGKNFGCGSSREQAVICLKQIGIGAVIAKSFSRIFYRNAINQGLIIVESFEAVDFIQNMDELEINLDDSYIFNKTKNQYFKINPLPAFMQNIINHGGLINTIK